jgi:hypothetical protein
MQIFQNIIELLRRTRIESVKSLIPLQSFMRTKPKMWSAAFSTVTGLPSSFPGPIKIACNNTHFFRP